MWKIHLQGAVMFKFKCRQTHSRVIFRLPPMKFQRHSVRSFSVAPFSSTQFSCSHTHNHRDSIPFMCYVCRFRNTKSKGKINKWKKKNRERKIEWTRERKKETNKKCVGKPKRRRENIVCAVCALCLSEKATNPHLPPLTASLLLHGEGLWAH